MSQPPKHQGRREPHQDGHPDERHERRAHLDRRRVGLEVGLAASADALGLPRLRTEGLDGRHAGQIVREAGVQLPGALAHLGVARLEAPLEAEAAPDDERHREEGEGRDLGSEDHESGTHHEHRRRGLEDVARAPVEEALELVHVVVQDGHEATGRAVLEPSELEAEHVTPGGEARVVLDALSQLPPEHLVEVLEEALRAPDDGVEHAEGDQLLGERRQPEQIGEEAALLPHHDVHRHPDQERRREVEDPVHHGADRRQDQRPSPVRGVTPEAAERMGRAHLPRLAAIGPSAARAPAPAPAPAPARARAR